jgi:hypothetical protein
LGETPAYRNLTDRILQRVESLQKQLDESRKHDKALQQLAAESAKRHKALEKYAKAILFDVRKMNTYLQQPPTEEQKLLVANLDPEYAKRQAALAASSGDEKERDIVSILDTRTRFVNGGLLRFAQVVECLPLVAPDGEFTDVEKMRNLDEHVEAYNAKCKEANKTSEFVLDDDTHERCNEKARGQALVLVQVKGHISFLACKLCQRTLSTHAADASINKIEAALKQAADDEKEDEHEDSAHLTEVQNSIGQLMITQYSIPIEIKAKAASQHTHRTTHESLRIKVHKGKVAKDETTKE